MLSSNEDTVRTSPLPFHSRLCRRTSALISPVLRPRRARIFVAVRVPAGERASHDDGRGRPHGEPVELDAGCQLGRSRGAGGGRVQLLRGASQGEEVQEHRQGHGQGEPRRPPALFPKVSRAVAVGLFHHGGVVRGSVHPHPGQGNPRPRPRDPPEGPRRGGPVHGQRGAGRLDGLPVVRAAALLLSLAGRVFARAKFLLRCVRSISSGID
jgi:hypothetical protein